MQQALFLSNPQIYLDSKNASIFSHIEGNVLSYCHIIIQTFLFILKTNTAMLTKRKQRYKKI